MQEIYLKRDKPLISLAFSGKEGIHVKLPPGISICTAASRLSMPNGEEIQIDQETMELSFQKRKCIWSFSLTDTEWQKWRNSLIGDVIECLDELFGLNIPVFIFGYLKMRRGISFRSGRR